MEKLPPPKPFVMKRKNISSAIRARCDAVNVKVEEHNEATGILLDDLKGLKKS